MNKHKITTKLIIGSLLLVSIPMMVPAETLSQILTAQTERTLLAQESQQRVDKISDQTNKLVDQYRATLKEIDGLQIYNKLLELQIETSIKKSFEMKNKVGMAVLKSRQTRI